MKPIEYYKEEKQKMIDKAINILSNQPSNLKELIKISYRLSYLNGIITGMEK